MILFKQCIVVTFLSFMNCFQEDSNTYNGTKLPSPLIIVPGDGGSRAYANINYYLFKIKRLLWVDFEYMLFPGEMRKVLKLIYDPETHTTRDATNSAVTFPGWGSTEMIEDLDSTKHHQTTYFAPLVQELMKDKFYVRNRTLRGTPYDFRKTPNEMVTFMKKLKILVEETYTLVGNERVVLLGHSLGSLFTLYFLNEMSLSWKKQYIRTFIAISSPVGGAVKALKLEISGDSMGSPVGSIHFRELERSFPSTAFLLPKIKAYGTNPIVITANKNYSILDFESLFNDMGFPYGAMMYKESKDLIDTFKAPEGIDELYCIHGYGLKTQEKLIYKSFPDEEPLIIYSDGDGTVNIQSLRMCKNWKNVKYYTIGGAEHMDIVGHPKFLNKLKQILYKEPKKEFPISCSYDLPKEKFIIQIF